MRPPPAAAREVTHQHRQIRAVGPQLHQRATGTRERLVRVTAAVTRLRGVAALDLLRSRVHQPPLAGLQILEQRPADARELLVARVAQRERRHLVPGGEHAPVAHFEPVLEVRDPEHQAAMADRPAHEPGRVAEARALALRLVVEHVAEQPQQVRPPARGPHEVLHLSRREQQADPVVVAHRRETQHGHQLGGQLALLLRGGAEAHRARDVHDQQHGQLAFLDEALHVRMTGARGDVPVDVADLVAGHVRPHFLELDAASLEHALAPAGEKVSTSLRLRISRRRTLRRSSAVSIRARAPAPGSAARPLRRPRPRPRPRRRP